VSNSNSDTSGAVATRKGGATIVLDDVTKQYPGQQAPAVDHLNMEIPAGEIVVLVGPSGCGKTTSMKMINRLIEPTSGRILIDGVDALTLEPDEHRRHIGYVIQQIGLFPHMTIAENIALVPRMEKWDKSRTRARVDELLDLVGLAPSEYRDRFPRQLSGGQQQRVGVVRALAVDPPVMLMDEPFGATDPITREHLQNEFLRLQRELRKTIVFVTHDFDEALKMGDRIAVLKERSTIAQYDTPTAILADPADDYVASFIGAGGQLKRLALMPLESAALHPHPAKANGHLPTVDNAGSLRDALDAMLHAGEETAVVVDESGSPQGSLTMGDLMGAIKSSERPPSGDDRNAVGAGS
jgi:osmoprotectant transport system ATP-binding protein